MWVSKHSLLKERVTVTIQAEQFSPLSQAGSYWYSLGVTDWICRKIRTKERSAAPRSLFMFCNVQYKDAFFCGGGAPSNQHGWNSQNRPRQLGADNVDNMHKPLAGSRLLPKAVRREEAFDLTRMSYLGCAQRQRETRPQIGNLVQHKYSLACKASALKLLPAGARKLSLEYAWGACCTHMLPKYSTIMCTPPRKKTWIRFGHLSFARQCAMRFQVRRRLDNRAQNLEVERHSGLCGWIGPSHLTYEQKQQVLYASLEGLGSGEFAQRAIPSIPCALAGTCVLS